MKTAIAYYWVSTDQQGKSGLGLEAQQEAVRLFTEREGYQVAPITPKSRAGRKQTPAAISRVRPMPEGKSHAHYCQA